MAKSLNPSLINDYRVSIENFAKNLVANIDSPFKKLTEGTNLNTIKKTYIVKFTENLKSQGLDIYLSKRIAKEQARLIEEDVLRDMN